MVITFVVSKTLKLQVYDLPPTLGSNHIISLKGSETLLLIHYCIMLCHYCIMLCHFCPSKYYIAG